MFSNKITLLAVGAGVAILTGVLIALGPARFVDIEDDVSAATDAPEVDNWPYPAKQSPDRTGRALLELVGVHVGTEDAIAMIREKDGATHLYRVGDQVVGDRELMEIHETHVFLRNEGRMERLRITGRNPRQFADPEELQEFAEHLIRPPDVADGPPPD